MLFLLLLPSPRKEVLKWVAFICLLVSVCLTVFVCLSIYFVYVLTFVCLSVHLLKRSHKDYLKMLHEIETKYKADS